MRPAPQDFCVGITLDNGLLLQDIVSGKPVPLAEILSLTSMVQSLFVVTTLATRAFDRIEDCHRAWAGTAAVLSQVLQVWDGVKCDDPNVSWMLERIQHFASLAEDRVEMFSISEKERLRHAKTRDADVGYSFTERHGVEPQGVTAPGSPAHIYKLAPMP